MMDTDSNLEIHWPRSMGRLLFFPFFKSSRKPPHVPLRSQRSGFFVRWRSISEKISVTAPN